MCSMFNLNIWDNDAEYLILDDIPFEHLGDKRKALWGAQKEMVLSDKYCKKRNVRWGKPMIFLCNPGEDFRNLPFTEKSGLRNGLELEWYTANCTVVTINEKLWI